MAVNTVACFADDVADGVPFRDVGPRCYRTVETWAVMEEAVVALVVVAIVDATCCTGRVNCMLLVVVAVVEANAEWSLRIEPVVPDLECVYGIQID